MIDVLLVLAQVFGIVCFGRLLLQIGRLNIVHPLAQFTLRLTQWCVKPLRRIVPPLGRFDSASCVAALLVMYIVHMAVAAWSVGDIAVWGRPLVWAGCVAATLLMALKAAAYALLIGLVLQSLLSWRQRPSHLLTVLNTLYRPLTRPFAWMRYRQFDFSAAVLALLLWWWLVSVVPYLQQSLNAWALQ